MNPERVNVLGTSSKSDENSSKHVNQAIQPSSLLCCDIVEGKRNNKSKCNQDAIEQGTDLTDPSVCLDLVVKDSDTIDGSKVEANHKRISRSVGSYDDDKVELYSSITLGSDPFLNSSGFNGRTHEDKRTYLPKVDHVDEMMVVEKWLNSNMTPTEGKHYSEDLKVLEDRNEDTNNSPLTRRTDALLNTTSFNLVKPKYSD